MTGVAPVLTSACTHRPRRARYGGGVNRMNPFEMPPKDSRHDATILFADLRGFSAIASRYPADVVLTLLNRCFGRMVDIIASHYGTVDKFMGDAIMAVFHGGDCAMPREHAQRAVL